MDYQETFALVAKMHIVKNLLSLPVNFDRELQQYDVKNAFLCGDLKEEIKMSIPLGFNGGDGNKVCWLNKALYGLKRPPHAWFGSLPRL